MIKSVTVDLFTQVKIKQSKINLDKTKIKDVYI
jgi:hypothetical protein